ncbi:LacI family DNA-binding transcriptional regulator [Arthrobacter sp. OY3WO11]|uniref:LacI family DNA-binding transcriptional regulator n=1 Tax=Arthrobacter sp. OY3WO11 TaxID=1835723 RepID=UPI0007D01D1B|nr:LacI family DNA-binding transcriptional regulator [Arthrobacter sp. OY3WO11]OAE00398.1 LacI family transcriptional regulator [Arthrobacter sp. OY3WO11]
MAGIRDVARLAGVSQATASRALSGKGSVSARAREAVTAAASELGFVMSYHASSLASGRSHNIGVVLPFVNRWYFATLLEGANSALMDAGYDLTLYDFQGDRYRESVLGDFLLRKRLDGVLAVSLQLNAHETEQILAAGIPVVGVGGPLPEIPTLRIDDVEVGRRATNHLISLGHTRVAHLGGEHELGRNFEISSGRRAGYEEAMAEAGLPLREAWSLISDYSANDAYKETKQLLADAEERPTAIFCASDEMAFGAILAARDLGLRIPEELSVIGVDGHEMGEILGLTTIDQFPRNQGTRAVERLLALVQDDGDTAAGPADELMETRLVVRSSTSAPRIPARQSGS